MTELQITILGCGTSTGVPVAGCQCHVCTSTTKENKRLRCSIWIQSNCGASIIVDTGPDFRQQAIRAGIPALDGVLYTHGHADHILGVDDLRAYNFVQKETINLYATSSTQDIIKRFFNYIFNPDPSYEGGMLAQLSFLTIEPLKPFTLAGLSITPFPLLHGTQEVLGFKIGNFAYATDCSAIPEVTRELLRGIDCLILDGLRHRSHSTHFTIAEALQAADEMEVGRVYLTHMTHDIDYVAESKLLPANAELCYDGLTFKV